MHLFGEKAEGGGGRGFNSHPKEMFNSNLRSLCPFFTRSFLVYLSMKICIAIENLN